MLGVDVSLINAAAVVLALSLSANGLLALALINASRHWFLRTAVYLAALSLLLVIPAPELVLMFGLQAALIALGSHWLLRGSRGNDSASPPRLLPRFTMGGLLGATAVVAYLAAVVANLSPDDNLLMALNLTLIAVAAAASAIGGVVVAGRRGRKRIAAALAALILCALAGVGVAAGDWLLTSFGEWTSWPPDPDANLAQLMGASAVDFVPGRWLAVLAAILVLAVVAALCSGSLASSTAAGVDAIRPTRLFWYRCGVIALLMVHAIPLGWLWMRMAFPPAIPVVELPHPNGREVLLQLEPAIGNSPLGGAIDFSTASLATLKKELAKSQELIDALHTAIDKPLMVDLDYDVSDLPDFQTLRNASRILAAEGKAAWLDARPADAVEAYSRIHRLGTEGRRGGLIVDGLVGIAIAQVALNQIYEMRADVPDPATLAGQLLERWKATEPYDDFSRRDKVWSMYAHGWHGRLTAILESWVGPSFSFFGDELSEESYRRPWLNEAALTKLTALKLLAIDFRRRTGSPPRTVADLLAGRSLDDFRDPLDPEAGSLRMKPLTGGVLFYSVGANGVDDDGAEPDDSDGSMWFTAADDTGDMRLDLIFGQQSPAEDDEADDGNAASNDEQTAAPLDPPASPPAPN